IPILVKDVVGRQEALAESGLDLAALKEHSGVEQGATFARLVGFGDAYEYGGRSAENLGQLLQHLPTARDKGRVQKKIARRVTEQSELGGHNQAGAAFLGLARRFHYPRGVTLQVGYGVVSLYECDFHGPSAVKHKCQPKCRSSQRNSTGSRQRKYHSRT